MSSSGGGTGPTATTSDNSSDSASHGNKKTSTRSEIEIIDQKMVKCINDINYYKQKIQREWSKQMNSHLKSFYPDDVLNESGASGNNKSITGDSLNNNSLTNSFTSPPSNADSAEYDRKISLLTKKLRSYEKRRHKLVYESKQQEQQASLNQQQPQQQQPSPPEAPEKPDNVAAVVGQLAPPLPSFASQPNKLNQLSSAGQRSGSFVANINTQTGAATSRVIGGGHADEPPRVGIVVEDTTKAGGSTFYISSNDPASSGAGAAVPGSSSTAGKFSISSTTQNLTSPANESSDLIGDEQNSSTLMPNKSYQALDRNMFYIQVEQQLYFLKLQQEKMQSDIEEINKKVQDNHQLMIKELQSTCSQISEHVHKISFNFYKSCDSKLEDLKSSFDRSIQSFGYNLTHCHRDIKDAKEDVAYMKNKIEIIEKSQKVHSIETSPTNYYQLFYKLLDILLTLATIILLAFTNMIASIKFVFLLYPRLIVMLFLIYFFFFYMIDQEKLDIYFHKILLNDSKYAGASSLSANQDYASSQAQLGLFRKLMHVVYRFVFRSSAPAAPLSPDPAPAVPA